MTASWLCVALWQRVGLQTSFHQLGQPELSSLNNSSLGPRIDHVCISHFTWHESKLRHVYQPELRNVNYSSCCIACIMALKAVLSGFVPRVAAIIIPCLAFGSTVRSLKCVTPSRPRFVNPGAEGTLKGMSKQLPGQIPRNGTAQTSTKQYV